MASTPRKRLGDEEAAQLTQTVLGAAIEVHRVLGPGLLESAYAVALAHELGARGLAFERQVAFPLTYKGATLDVAFVADLVVENAVIVELKAVESENPAHKRQLLTYLRLSGCRHGLLLNFGAARMVEGITRIVDGYA